MNYRSINDLNTKILEKLFVIPRDIDLIVGVPRSGMLPANLIALYLNLPYTDLQSFIKGYIYKSGARKQFFNKNEFKNILVVDDSIASGAALKKCKNDLKHLKANYNFKYLVIYSTTENQKYVDYSLENVPTPRYFQWNIFNHSGLENACFDIDGVLCVDPTEIENDDGNNYKTFLKNALPLYLPGSKIGTLVTSRLEKYRKDTENWLAVHNIQYSKLIMLDLPDMRTRQLKNNHAQHKSNEYQKNRYNLFVESNLNQAIEINRITNKPVFCTENFKMIYESQSFIYNLKYGKNLPAIRRNTLKLRNHFKKIFIKKNEYAKNY